MSAPPLFMRPLRLRLCLQLRPKIPSALSPELAAVCSEFQSGVGEAENLDTAVESRILLAYAADDSPENRQSALDFARILGRAAVQTLDLSDYFDVPPAAGKHAGDRERRGVLAEIPSILRWLTPVGTLRIEFEDDSRAVVRCAPAYALDASVLEFERLYLLGMLEEFVGRCGWSKTIRVNAPGVEDAPALESNPAPYTDTTVNQPAVSLAWSSRSAGEQVKHTARVAATPRDQYNEPRAIAEPPAEEAVVRKSAELLKERKELLTAVEYLHLANTELERQIRMNKRELEMARNIQKGFVPRRIPDWKGLQFWVKFFPMAEVSGDFYDFFTLGSNKLGIMVCDVSGHGVPAALISAIAKLSFKSHNLDSPAEVFNAVNLDLLNYVKKEGYLTCFYMIVNSQNEIVYSVGAAPPPMLLRAKSGAVE
ncbi:MAG: SpoIIE family protein phosphatase, partial [Leptospirales bacterium]